MSTRLIPFFLLLAGCTSSLVDYESRFYVVQSGDTLYSIGWRHGIDTRELARWNNLRNPDRIYVGQRLRLTPTAYVAAAEPPNRERARGTPAVSRVPAASTERVSSSSSLPAPRSLPPPRWQWPTEGRVVSTFGSGKGIATGIAIGGRVGQPVHAAAPGRVVYSGSGLIGYGQLVIIKHNETYLSAYGHNDSVLVVQGQDVERGARIASMGTGPEREPRLHFEIRRNGVPVDPMQFLASAR
jgi:lipoprotein NlpD